MPPLRASPQRDQPRSPTMDAGASTLRSGRRWRRTPQPSPRRQNPPESGNADHEGRGGTDPRGAAALFSCGVCLETAGDPVVTRCGHLFCWACLYRWVRCRHPRGACPICKSMVTVEPGDVAGVTPIYGVAGESDAAHGGGGGGSGGDGDLSPEVPPRPRGLQVTSEGENLEVFREEMRILSRDVDVLEQRMCWVMATVAQLPRPLLIAYAAEVARRNGTTGASLTGRRRRSNVLRTQNNDGGGDGVYRRTRSRTRATRQEIP